MQYIWQQGMFAVVPCGCSERVITMGQQGHPGNMAVVLFAMGGYGAAYLGWQIRVSDNRELVLKAKELHPKVCHGSLALKALLKVFS